MSSQRKVDSEGMTTVLPVETSMLDGLEEASRASRPPSNDTQLSSSSQRSHQLCTGFPWGLFKHGLSVLQCAMEHFICFFFSAPVKLYLNKLLIEPLSKNGAAAQQMV